MNYGISSASVKSKGVHKQTKALPIVCECDFHTLHFLTLIHALTAE